VSFLQFWRRLRSHDLLTRLLTHFTSTLTGAIPGKVVQETDDEYEDGVTSSSDVVEVPGSHERSTDTRKTIDGHQHHHPDGDRLGASNNKET